ncbi:hypothetical protein LCGC14_0355640 [marine sediment metagenome]|uniref:Recombination endonuclease VII n=1 Tax=marine sediment metagenome TaxID=412755 RepID=A0A0F9TSB1_9ZZZZ
MITKRCPTCKHVLAVTYFWPNKRKYDGLGSECKECQRIRINRWRKTPAGRASRKEEYRKQYETGKILKRQLRDKYSLTVDQYNNMFGEQGGLCAICDKSLKYLKANVDHNHTTGKVRGLLCSRCNTLLVGLDDSAFLNRATKYLLKHDD